LKATLEKAFPGVSIELIESGGGAFEIRKGDKLIYSKLETGQFPDDAEIVSALS